MSDPYIGREQTKAKHFILKRYLQALAFKILGFSDISYVDGFSGPWETHTETFADTSFMIAIEVLLDAQKQIQVRSDQTPRVRCFLCESDSEAFTQLTAAVEPFNKPRNGFEIIAHHGKFENAIPEILSAIGNSFPLIFIDPTGWTGYSFDKIRPLFERRKCEVLINFMYDFINRAVSMSDPKTVKSLEPILGGPNWERRLDPGLPRGAAVEKLFRDTLRDVGRFEYVISTKIDRSTRDRPHFFVTYGTKSFDGLKAFRETEYVALRVNARDRAEAKERQRETKTRSPDLFPGMDAQLQESSIDEIVAEQAVSASNKALFLLQEQGPMLFDRLCAILLEVHMLRVTNVKDICVQLAASGKIEDTWRPRNRKPVGDSVIRLPVF